MPAKKMPPSKDQPDKGDDALTVPAEFEQQEAPDAGRDRRALAAEVGLDPMSLSGSYFHRVENGAIVWDGIVVGEVQAGKYLCTIDRGLEGAHRVKVSVIVPIERMLAADEGYEYRFYDTEEERTLATAAMNAAREPAYDEEA